MISLLAPACALAGAIVGTCEGLHRASVLLYSPSKVGMTLATRDTLQYCWHKVTYYGAYNTQHMPASTYLVAALLDMSTSTLPDKKTPSPLTTA